MIRTGIAAMTNGNDKLPREFGKYHLIEAIAAGGMAELYRDINFPQPNNSSQFDAGTHVAIRRNYSAMVENIDRWLGVYLEELRKRGELDNTLIVYSSDHGEMLGDHDLWGKRVPFQPSVGIPMIIAGPGTVRGMVSEMPVSLMDLCATFLEYAGISPLPEMESLSLKQIHVTVRF